jgi:hypothetical protein
LLAVGCGSEVSDLAVGDVEYTTGPGGAEPNLQVTTDGRVLLTWLEPVSEGQHALRLAVRKRGVWSDPKTVLESEHFFVNWADFPSLVEMGDGSWLVHWLEKTPGNKYAYHVKLAVSKDGGLAWGTSFSPHRDDSPTEHGFVSMVPWNEGAALIWLDGRAMTIEASGGEHEGLNLGEMSIRATTVDGDGALGPDVLLDSRTCECCQTSLVRTSRGLLAAYRDRSEAEIRNISVVRFVDGSWSEPSHVADDNWYYPGCPVNGPQLSARGDTVVVAWFTAPDQQSAVYAAFSHDGGGSFGPPIRIDDGDPLGRVDAEILDDGRAAVTWMERSEDAAEIRVRLVEPSSTGPSFRVAQTSEARASGFPRIVQVGGEVLVAWTSVAEDGGVNVTALGPPE